jgi:hypothetical protein
MFDLAERDDHIAIIQKMKELAEERAQDARREADKYQQMLNEKRKSLDELLQHAKLESSNLGHPPTAALVNKICFNV